MAIVTAKCVPYYVMKEFLEGRSVTNSIAVLANRHDRVWICSITNADSTAHKTPVLVKEDQDDRIGLQFDDVEDTYDSYSGAEKPRDRHQTYFDERMARKICEFVKKAHEHDPESSDLFVVNCHMGISRSGAVSDFVRTVCGLDYDSWKRMNPTANPNILVKSLLTWVWRESMVNERPLAKG